MLQVTQTTSTPMNTKSWMIWTSSLPLQQADLAESYKNDGVNVLAASEEC